MSRRPIGEKNRQAVNTTVDTDVLKALKDRGITLSDFIHASAPMLVDGRDMEVSALRCDVVSLLSYAEKSKRKAEIMRAKADGMEAQANVNIAKAEEMRLRGMEKYGVDVMRRVLPVSNYQGCVDYLVEWLPERLVLTTDPRKLAGIAEHLCLQRYKIGRSMVLDCVQEALDRIRIEQGV